MPFKSLMVILDTTKVRKALRIMKTGDIFHTCQCGVRWTGFFRLSHYFTGCPINVLDFFGSISSFLRQDDSKIFIRLEYRFGGRLFIIAC